MKSFQSIFSILISCLVLPSCGASPADSAMQKELDQYIQKTEVDNDIRYREIRNTRGSYITPMCYTRTRDESTGKTFNPCYTCHTRGKIPNYYNDSVLQTEYNFPQEMHVNPYRNLFRDKSQAVDAISDADIERYIRENNYLDEHGQIQLAKNLPVAWPGYRPDIYFNFDKEGFDRNPTGGYSGWRAFRYTPFPGTFWPTNGSTDDVMIRLDSRFSSAGPGKFDPQIYRLNLAIVEALVKQSDIPLAQAVDESIYQVDLDKNGAIDTAAFISSHIDSYVGLARQALENGEIHLAAGLYPENTEFLHSVRYLDPDEKTGQVNLSARMKELRYARKYGWSSYSDIDRISKAELWEANSLDSEQARLSVFRGDYQHGLKNELSWIYQGFIEDRSGNLRPQTHEETIACMGCHSHLGATTDSTFAFARKLEGSDPNANDYGWNHWSQKGLTGVKEPHMTYLNRGEKREYLYYLENNHSGNEFRDNEEVIERFFNPEGQVRPEMKEALRDDISWLLLPSRTRALQLNKAYKVLVQEQSFIYGRDANVEPVQQVYRKIQPGLSTGIEQTIVQ